MKTAKVKIALLAMLLIGASSLCGSLHGATSITFSGEELLGKPTNTSIAVNIIPSTSIEYQYQYGTSSASYSGQTSNRTATGGQPDEVTISGLTPDTQYYYRMRYRLPGETDWIERPEHSFWTQRAPGNTFIFSVTSDSHGTFNQQVLQHISTDHPDFNLDLGDTFMVDNTTSQSGVNTKYLTYRDQSHFGAIGNSVSIFLSSGNHENEEGWNLDDSPFSIAVGSIKARKLYYPTPINDGFYTGNLDPLGAIDAATYGDQFREDYYSWEWGDALFVVIDPFQYTLNLPYAPGAAGEGTDDPQNGDQWSWTLGAQQFKWFKETIQNSNAKFKFVFSHQMVGGIPNLTVAGVGPGYVRGGAQAAAYFEWGGKNADGTAGFESHRNASDFGTKPLHQLMVENGVSAYFHGHDHQYVYEKRDGIVYQEVPSAGAASAFSGVYTEGSHGDYETIKILTTVGHLRITVTPTQAMVDYVPSSGTTYSYTIEPRRYLYGDFGTADCDVDGSDLAMAILYPINYEDDDISTFAGNFGKSSCP